MIFSKEDIKQIQSKGLTVDKVLSQIEVFKKGIQYLNLNNAATVNLGIIKMNPAEVERYIANYELRKDALSIVKFVPASGAATRMFKFLFQFIEKYNPKEESINSYINKNKANDISLFYVGLEKFPFFKTVIKEMETSISNYHELSYNNKLLLFVKTMLDNDKLNMSDMPKGLFPFHTYKKHIATAFEEHLFEGALYASSNGKADLHFTISEKHNHKFDERFKKIQERIERKTNIKFNIDFSFQIESTDTIAITKDFEPFRNENGSVVFRPAGHGALIENLNTIEADIIFIKNIDNVVVFKFEEEVAKYKKALAGLLLKVQEEAFKYSKLLENTVNEETVFKIATFLSNKMNVDISIEFEKYSLKHQIEYLKEKLNRPIRVCGMVKNEGEPGGGPFWVKSESGKVSLQIVEAAQVDNSNKNQKEIFKNATHFNPVDLVCGIKNYKGEKYNLNEFVNPNAAFISTKTQAGKEMLALELPGLWNGAMAKWNTIFVEVPLITFNPVKTVNDLLKPAHQVN
jgi:hypothetical protein